MSILSRLARKVNGPGGDMTRIEQLSEQDRLARERASAVLQKHNDLNAAFAQVDFSLRKTKPRIRRA